MGTQKNREKRTKGVRRHARTFQILVRLDPYEHAELKEKADKYYLGNQSQFVRAAMKYWKPKRKLELEF